VCADDLIDDILSLVMSESWEGRIGRAGRVSLKQSKDEGEEKGRHGQA
jgi:hypothetical protein